MESVSYKLMLNGLGPTALGAEIPITLRFDAGETFGFTAIVQKLEPVATDQPAVLLADEVGDPRADPPNDRSDGSARDGRRPAAVTGHRCQLDRGVACILPGGRGRL